MRPRLLRPSRRPLQPQVTHADETRAQHLVDLLQQGIVIPPDTAISIAAANLSMRHKIAMADSLIYATALASKATLWAQNDDFKGLTHVKYFPKTKTGGAD